MPFTNQNSPLLKHNVVNYSWRQLAQRAGILQKNAAETGFEDLGLSLHYAPPGQTLSKQFAICVAPCREDAWTTLLERCSNSLDWLPPDQVMPPGRTLPVGHAIPVIFWGAGYEDGHKPFAERRDGGTIIFYADIIAATFFMLSRWEEIVNPHRDEHGRFPAVASVAYKQRFLNRPIIDEYALILCEWIKVLLSGWKPEPRRFTIRLSHDVDHIIPFSSTRKALRTLADNVMKQRSSRQSGQTIYDWLQQTVMPHRVPQLQGIYNLAHLSNMYDLPSAFFFMTANYSSFDPGYDITSPLIRQCVADLLQQGHEVGFHPGYYTLNNPELLAKEKSKLDNVLGFAEYGGRQHYLRFCVPHTWRHWEQVGLTYDSTLGYADHEGFRCGTCHPFQPFDLEQDRQLDLWELPLIVMEGTLKQYRGFTPAEGLEKIFRLIQKCQRVGGTFTLLWHNSSLDREWFPWFIVYQSVLNLLATIKDD